MYKVSRRDAPDHILFFRVSKKGMRVYAHLQKPIPYFFCRTGSFTNNIAESKFIVMYYNCISVRPASPNVTEMPIRSK